MIQSLSLTQINSMESRLKIAIQKSGRLSEKSNELLEECGISYSVGSRSLLTSAENFPLDILLLRDDDIPQYVEDGVADIGILGENVVEEMAKDIQIVKRLGFAKCKLSLAVPKEIDYTDIHYFEGKRVATSYPVILQKYLGAKGVSVDIHQISGSVEIAPSIGLADAIFDIVSTGGTLQSNGLKEVEVLMRAEAVLVGNKHLNASQQAILEELLFRIDAVLGSKGKKYVLLNAPAQQLNRIIELLPGAKSPTITPLAVDGWVAVHAVMDENDFWKIVRPLKALGAEGILVIPIEKIIP